MSVQDEERPRATTGTRVWMFLNSKFGLFLLSSVGVSFVTWMYTEVSQSIEQRAEHAASAMALDSEIEYRIRLMNNYFISDCAEHSELDHATITDIRDIYEGNSQYEAITPWNRGKNLHTLIWERAALLKADKARDDFRKSFDELTLQFNAYLTRLVRELERSAEFYGSPVDYPKEVEELITRFTSAIQPMAGTYDGIVE
jgi:hypothetical protein